MSESTPDWQDDLTPILGRWEFSKSAPQLRFLVGIGDVVRIQIRLEAGLLQFEVDGRPDGSRPQGCESWFDYWSCRPECISWEGVGALLAEVALYHQRAVAFMLLDDFASCTRDCERNIAAIAFVHQRAAPGADTAACQTQQVAAVLLRTRAAASVCVRLRDTHGALAAIDRGLAALHRPVGQPGQLVGSPESDSPESALLRSMRDALVPKLPSSQRVDLETRLRSALRLENYELAVILRNELRQIGD
ncbi:MAG: hypothetical protein EXS17_03090 [Phycisphaerales bacterium]|nr:hypothetical protein [Phycisphaerales bacterium]